MKVLKFIEPLFGVLIGAILFLVGIGILSVVAGVTVKVTTRSYDAVREEIRKRQPPPPHYDFTELPAEPEYRKVVLTPEEADSLGL